MMNAMFPPAASAHAGGIDQLIDGVHVLMLLLFIGWIAFFLYAIFRFRAKRNPVADYVGVKSKRNTYLEIVVGVAEAILLFGFSIPMWAERVDHAPPEEEATTVRLIAQQFAWNFWYAGPDGVFGPQKIELVDDATNPIGLDRSHPDAKDDITTINQLHLPVAKPAIIHITSRDVIHSFNLPNMRIKQDAVPGMSIPVWFEPTKTTAQLREETGDDAYVMEIACAQLCGNSHYRMRGFLTVETQEEFEAWLEAEALVQGGEDPFAAL